MNSRRDQDAIFRPTTPQLPVRIAIAAAGSLVVHALFVGGAMRGLADVFRWQSNAEPPPLVVSARLVEVAPPAPAPVAQARAPAAKPKPRIARPAPVAAPVLPTPPRETARADAPPAAPDAPASAEKSAAADAGSAPASAESAPQTAAPAPPPASAEPATSAPARSVRTSALPPSAQIRFEVTVESNNSKIAALQTWSMADGRYRITFAAEVRALFFSLGSMSLESQGVIAAAGLRPERYVDVRNRRRSTVNIAANEKSAEIEEANGNRKSVLLAGQAADIMSLTYDLAFNPDIGIGTPFTLINRERLEEVRLVEARDEVLITEAGNLNTRYFEFRRPDGTSGIQVWLAIERQWLPARIRLAGRDGGLNMVATAYDTSPAPERR
ncbi:MAG: DUF3108 domain-containing protein [Burkholderiales bacterium]|nr:DUF3108 domain-containing protein [Burkholderiales bacterium]